MILDDPSTVQRKLLSPQLSTSMAGWCLLCYIMGPKSNFDARRTFCLQLRHDLETRQRHALPNHVYVVLLFLCSLPTGSISAPQVISSIIIQWHNAHSTFESGTTNTVCWKNGVCVRENEWILALVGGIWANCTRLGYASLAKPSESGGPVLYFTTDRRMIDAFITRISFI